MTSRAIRTLAATALGGSLLAATAGAQGTGLPTERAVFVVLVNHDTIAVEVASRSAARADGDLRMRTPELHVRQSLSIQPGELVDRAGIAVGRGTASDSAMQHSAIVFRGDSAVATVDQPNGAPLAPQRIGVEVGTLPFVNLSGVSLEQLLRRARALGGDTTRVPLLLITGQPVIATVARLGADSALITMAGVQLRARVDSAGRLLGASVPSQRLIFERLAGDAAAARWIPSAPVRSYAAPSGAPYTAEDVVVRTPAGLKLAGTLTIPRHDAGRRVPAVVMITGSGPQDRDEAIPAISEEYRPFREIADTLSRRGIAVLRLDDRGVGGSDAGPANATTADFADDVRAALAWLRARPEVDPSRLGLVGHSEGGIIAPMVAATDPRLRGIALVAGPASKGIDVVHDQVRYILSQDTTLTRAARDSLLRVGLAQADSVYRLPGWRAWFASYDPRATARRVRTPTLILQGETDRQVPMAEAAALAAAFRAGGNRGVTVRTFPRMNHLMLEDPSGNPLRYQSLPSFHLRNDLRGALADWLAKTL